MAFNAEVITETLTIIATAALTAGDPVTAAGAKASDSTDFLGVAASDAAIGDAFPVITEGLVAVDMDSAAIGIVAGGAVTYATDGYDTAGVGNGFGFALDTAAAGGQMRFKIKHASVA